MDNNLNALSDAEKTRLLAEGVMGWKAKPKRSKYASWFDGKVAKYPVSCCDYWDPINNEAHAAEVREAMRAKGWNISQSYHPCGLNTTGIFMMPDGPLYHANKGSAPETLCHAALLALGLAKEEEL